MFWKRADRHAPGDPRGAAWSITVRLSLLYFASSACILLTVSGILYWSLEQKLALRDNAALAQQLNVLRHILLERDETSDVEWQRQWEERSDKNSPFQSRVLDPRMNVLAESPIMDAPVAAFPPAADVTEAEGPVYKWNSPSHDPYKLMAAWSESADQTGKQWLIQVALDMSESEEILDAYRQQLLALMLAALLVVAAVAFFIARRGMRPLKHITEAAQRITANNFGPRLQSSRWPKELDALAAAFDQMLARLRESFTRQSQFSSDIAHELRTPINTLMMQTSVTLRQARGDVEYRELLESNLDEYRRIGRTIESMLFIARADNAQAPVHANTLDARHEIDAVREFFDALAEDRGVNLTCEGEATVIADSDLLRRALTNLVSNALHHTTRGGTIRLSTRQTVEGATEFEVADTGSGIDPQHLPRLFDRLYRVDPARSSDSGGIGLGLAIVQSIMGLHGGSVSVSSTVGHGSRFTLVFPTPFP